MKELLLSQVIGDATAFSLNILPNEQITLVDDVLHGELDLVFELQHDSFFAYVLKNNGKKSAANLGRVISVILAGSNADADVKCLLYGDAAHVFKIKTLQEHRAGNATSNVVIKAVLDDEARLTCRSMIKVLPGANGTHAEQVNKNILLSRRARAVSVPMLEVLANDVKCKHGAAVSQLNDDQAFYLQSRGISAEQTRTLLLEAFLN